MRHTSSAACTRPEENIVSATTSKCLERRLNIPPPHRHRIFHPIRVHEAEVAAAGFNERLAILLTHGLSSMWCTYLFALIAVIGFFGMMGWLNPFTFILATWLSQQFIQLLSLSILSAGQLVIGRKQELQADANFHTTNLSFEDIELILKRLDKQDEAILVIMKQLEQLLQEKN